MNKNGRIIEIGPTDNTSNERTPRERLHNIPDAARRSFVPYIGRLPSILPSEADLTRIAPGRPQASGDKIKLTGKLLNEYGKPLSNTLIEIWNANKDGKYTHIEDQTDVPLDPNFIGIGRTMTNDQGEYEFWTIRPGAYLARPDIGRWRPKHVHFSVLGGTSRLITQMYFKGDPHNDSDPMRILMGDQFDRNIGQEYEIAEDGFDCGYKFDIVIGGRQQTFFEG